MIRHYFVAALRNMGANRLLSAISILGLAIGLATAILAGLLIRAEYSYEHFLPGYQHIYVPLVRFGIAEMPEADNLAGGSRMAALLRLGLPEAEAVTQISYGEARLAQGPASARERIIWAEPNLFAVLPFPLLHGDAATALTRPDGLVLTAGKARQYFGRDNAVGRTILVNDKPMTVRAVIADMPLHATRFTSGIYGSSRAGFSPLMMKSTPQGEMLEQDGPVFLRLKPGTDADAVGARLPALLAPLGEDANGVRLMRLDRTHLMEDLNKGITVRLAAAASIGFFTLFIAIANFVNLMLARAARRRREVGVRKVCGAGRRALVLQFLGEAMLSVLLAAVVAIALVEWLLPAANAFLEASASFDYGTEPLLALALLLFIVLTGLLAGAWPAFILSGFRPARVLKGWLQTGTGAGAVRNLLVTAQFALLTVLAIAALVIWQQRNALVHEALRANTDQMLVVRARALAPAFLDEVRKLPGVRAALGSGTEFMQGGWGLAMQRYGKRIFYSPVRIDPGLFAFYGVAPLAGSVEPRGAPGLILNETLMRRLGFVSPQAALGREILPQKPWAGLPVLAVVPDLWLHPADLPIQPTVYVPEGFDFGVAWMNSRLVHIRLSGQQIPETLAAIDELWRKTGGEGAIDRFFFNQHMEERYVSLMRQAQLFSLFTGVAIFLACLGLIGIAISTAERRTKEIGVRKAMGATSGKVMALLLWQFSRPVLLANLIAWPIAFWLMQRWLSTFLYRIDLYPGLFVAVGGTTLAIAILSVAGQALLIARQKPVVALRYE